MSKKVILFVIDALADHYVRRKLHDAQLPHLAELIRDGGQVSTCISIFPSITPAATCSIATGQYPSAHGIQGAYWYDRDHHEFAYYGDDFRLIRKKGFERYLVDFGHRLNAERLRCKTIFETLSEHGVSTGCVNFMWYRGNTRHQRNTPWLIRAVTGGLDHDVWGPDMLKLGDFVDVWPATMRQKPSLSGGVFHRFGFSDANSMEAVGEMIKQDCLPDFTLAYLPQNDDLGHQVGPEAASDRVLGRFDTFLGELAKMTGGWDRLRQDYVILIVGDHAQSFLLEDQEEREIKLEDLIDGYSLIDTATRLDDEKIFYCANMRSAAIYRFGKNGRCHSEVTTALLSDPRIDQLIWHASESSSDRWHVMSERGKLSFWRASPEEAGATCDEFGNYWNHEGELATLDLRVQAGRFYDGDYPNPMERIAEAYIADDAKPLWVTAKDGYEFSTSDAHVNAAGSHASLSAEDSNSCFISSEAVADQSAPMRIVDVFAACMAPLVGERPQHAETFSVPPQSKHE